MVSEWSIWTSWLIELPFEKAIGSLVDLGFKHLELSAEHFNEYLARMGVEQRFLDEPSRPRALALTARGPVNLGDVPSVEFVHAHAPFSPFRLSSAVELESSIQVLAKWIEHCSDLGVRVLVCHPFKLQGESLEENAKVNERAYGELSRIAEREGVKLAVENVPRGFGSRGEHLVALAESFGLGICVDTGHANIEAYRGRVEKLVLEAGLLIEATHLSDNDGSGDQHLFPGGGSIDWCRVMEAFREVGYGKPLNLEIPGEAKKVRDPAKRIEYLASLLEKLPSLSTLS